jgi:hypothetical protein
MDYGFDAIARTLAEYFDGLYFSDTARLARAFHPDARYICATPGDRRQLGMTEYFAVVDQRPSPASRGEVRRDKVLSIEFAGPEAAFAKVACAIGPKRFTDLLTLVLDDGQWRIVSKVFHYELAEVPAAA